MRRALGPARLDRWIERELISGLPPRKRARLHEQLRRDPQARARYDRAVSALRVLEGDGDLAPSELDLVGRWLADELDPEGAEPRAEGARRWWPAMMTVLAAALVLLWAGPLQQASAPWWEGRDDGWQARGAASTGRLALEALCVAEGVDAPSRRARARECTRRDLMGFAYRVETGIDGQLTLFGVDADGDPMFYLPTPVDPSTPAVVAGRWRALKIAVRLSVNHATGPLRVYALVSPTAATADEVRGWAEQLAGQPAAGSGDAPWIERVSTESLARACPTLARCQAAELAFTIDD
ncbi:MAG: hypothetical protein H6712_03310 [Myxococcales bacterium]|nr:hypothetical protein [Myxococcales bacterium]MCB9712855.1 hypothetical protein [Myxococcales bacterium]